MSGGRDLAVGRAREMASAFELPTPFSVRAVLRKLERDRGRRIRLHPVPPGWGGTSGWCGAWLPEPGTDHIVFVRDPASTVRNALTVLHEVGHMVLAHEGAPLPPGVDLQVVGLPSVGGGRGRTAFDDPEEEAAEVFSSMLLRQALARGSVDLDDTDPQSVLLKARLG